MGSRRETPDILGELLGGNNVPSSTKSPGFQTTIFKQKDDSPENISATEASPSEAVTGNKSEKTDDNKLGESLLASAAGKIETAGKFLGKERLREWLGEMLRTLGQGEQAKAKHTPDTSLENRVVEWADKHLKAVGSRVNYHANGLKREKPYKVDVWTHLKGERYRPDLDVWIDCRYENEPVTQKDILEIVRKATDIFNAAHTDKQEFWFDRLMFVSLAPFEKEVLETADEHGVVCVFYDRTSLIIQTDPYWKLKPHWLKEAEENLANTEAPNR